MTSPDEKIGNAVLSLFGCGVLAVLGAVLAAATIWKVWVS
jgi:hypothetical protein